MFKTVKILLVGKDNYDFSFIKNNLHSVSPNPVEFEKVVSLTELNQKSENQYQLVICDVESGNEIVDYVCDFFHRPFKIFLCKEEDVNLCYGLFKKGAFDVLFYKDGVVPSEKLIRAI